MSSHYTLMSTGLGTLPRPFPGPRSTMYPQAYNNPTYTQTNIHSYQQYTYTNIHLYQHTLISKIMHTYINNNPYSTTPHNNCFPFPLQGATLNCIYLACQHKQYKQTHQHYFSKTIIIFHIIHYQVLRHQECIHSLGCSQY